MAEKNKKNGYTVQRFELWRIPGKRRKSFFYISDAMPNQLAASGRKKWLVAQKNQQDFTGSELSPLEGHQALVKLFLWDEYCSQTFYGSSITDIYIIFLWYQNLISYTLKV